MDEARVSSVRSLLIDAENNIRKANKILDYMMDRQTADQVTVSVEEQCDE